MIQCTNLVPNHSFNIVCENLKINAKNQDLSPRPPRPTVSAYVCGQKYSHNGCVVFPELYEYVKNDKLYIKNY